MHRNRTWTLDPPEWRTQRNRLLPIEGGDGSTLNLDFTKGTLDSRLNFSRLSTATFVNSSGYVEYAGANLLPNSATLQGTGWNIGGNGVGGTVTVTNISATNPENGETCTRLEFGVAAAGGSPRLYYTTTAINPYTMFVWMKSNTPATNYTISLYRNDTWADFPVTPTWTRFQITRTSGTGLPGYFMLANNSTSVQPDILVWGAQLNPGSTAQTYYPTTTVAYHAPRFDYDPTTLVAKGLLIEGAASNLATRSDDFQFGLSDGTGWANSGYTLTQVATVAPNGLTTNVRRITGAGSFRSQAITVVANTTYTFSFWVKKIGSGTEARYRVWDATNNASIKDYTQAAQNYFSYINDTTWTRASITFTTPATCTSVFVYPASNDVVGGTDILVWGGQLELGSVVSSYIPTGASAVQRVADDCFVSGSNFTSWFDSTQGTLLVTARSNGSYYDSSLYDFAAVLTKNTFTTNFIGCAQWSSGLFGVVRGGSLHMNYVNLGPTHAPYKTAIAYALNDYAAVANNGTVATSTGTPLPSGIDRLRIGGGAIGSTAAGFSGTIAQIKYFPTRLPNTQLKAITDPNYVAPTFDVDFTTMSTGADLTNKGLTFTRLGIATFINSLGYVEYAGSNMILGSQSFALSGMPINWQDNAIVSRTTAQPDPFGGSTAIAFRETETLDYHRISFYGTATNAITISIFVKQINAARRFAINANSYANVSALFDLTTGQQVGTTGGTAPNKAASITSYGAGWYRVSVTGTRAADSSFFFSICDPASTDTTGLNFMGTPTGGVYLWGAQINSGSILQTYYPTTTTAYHAPRFDYDPVLIGTPRGLLIESSTTNQIIYSEDFTKSAFWQPDTSGAALPTVTTVTNATTPANTLSVNQIVFNKTGGVYSRVSNSAIGIASQPYTMSVWMRTVTGTANVGLRIGADAAGFNCPVSTTWKRFQYTYTPSNTDVNAQIMLWDNIVGNDETATVYVWGCQLEAGSGASSYIPTGASTALRNPDNCYIYDATTSGGLSWLKTATQGTFYVEAHKRTAGTTFAGALYGTLATSTQDLMVYQAIGSNWLSFNWGGDNIVNYSAPASPRVLKSAVALSPGVPTVKADNTASANGTSTALNTSSNVLLPFTSNLFCIGSRGGNLAAVPSTNYADSSIKKFSFYPSVLTTPQLQTLTLPTLISPTLDLNFLSMSTHADLTANGLTFNRTTAATFINSSGYVELAASNEMTYSQGQDNNSFWNAYSTSVVRTAGQTDPNGGTSAVKLVFDATATDAVISRTVSVNNGLPYTISMWMRADSGTLTNVRFARGTTPTGAFFPTLTTEWQRVSLSFNASTTADGIEIRVLSTGSPKTATFYVYGAQLESGSTVRTYQPAIGAAAYHAPRFDYSPTNIGEPRGLLVEGQTANLCQRSQYCWGTGTTDQWSRSAQIHINSVIESSGANAVPRIDGPDNGSLTGTSIFKESGSSTFVRSSIPVTVSASTQYTYSIYVRAGTGGTTYFRLATFNGGSWMSTVGGCNDPTVTVTNEAGLGTKFSNLPSTRWVRVWVVLTTAVGQVSVTLGVYPNLDTSAAATNYIWGAQLEAGSGATSYIPTGISTATRFPDLLAVTNSTTMKLNTNEGTFFVETELPRGGTTSPAQFGAPYTNGSWFGNFYGAADATTLTANWWGGSVGGLARSGNTKSLTALSYGAYTGLALPFSSSLNGALSTGTMTSSGGNNAPNPATWSYITLACNTSSLATTSRDNLNACIKSFRYYPVKLTDAQLQSITA